MFMMAKFWSFIRGSYLIIFVYFLFLTNTILQKIVNFRGLKLGSSESKASTLTTRLPPWPINIVPTLSNKPILSQYALMQNRVRYINYVPKYLKSHNII